MGFVVVNKGIYSRPDPIDAGPGYRQLVGIPGGMNNSKVLEAMHRANTVNQTFVAGKGREPDTWGQNKVYIMDSLKFLVKQAELSMQFFDTQPADALLTSYEKRGLLKKTGCPPPLAESLLV